jgi:hypothetical protein
MKCDVSQEIESTIRPLLIDGGAKRLLREVSRTERNRIIRTALIERGESLGYKVSATGSNGWLYDIAWWSATSDGLMTDLPAVVEVEFRNFPIACCADIDDDFQKLVQARTDVRVWVVSMPNPELANKHIETCKRQVEQFSSTAAGDRYLFVTLIWSDNSFRIEPWQAR